MDTSQADPFSQYARAVGQEDPFAIGPNLLAMPPPGLTLQVTVPDVQTIVKPPELDCCDHNMC